MERMASKGTYIRVEIIRYPKEAPMAKCKKGGKGGK